MLFGISGKVQCNQCGEYTDIKKSERDSGYDDYGYQCIACATDSGLKSDNERRKRDYEQKLARRKEFGLT